MGYSQKAFDELIHLAATRPLSDSDYRVLERMRAEVRQSPIGPNGLHRCPKCGKEQMVDPDARVRCIMTPRCRGWLEGPLFVWND